jgi:hypothetical protein
MGGLQRGCFIVFVYTCIDSAALGFQVECNTNASGIDNAERNHSMRDGACGPNTSISSPSRLSLQAFIAAQVWWIIYGTENYETL